MGKLRYFNKSKYNGLGDLLSDIKKELEALQPQDSADITWSLSSQGISAKLKKFSARSETTTESNEENVIQTKSDGYNGFFALSVGSTNKDGKIISVNVSGGRTDLNDVASVAFSTDPNQDYDVILVLDRSGTDRPTLTDKLILAPYGSFNSSDIKKTYGNRTVLIGCVLNTTEKQKVVQHWTDGVVYWGSRFFI